MISIPSNFCCAISSPTLFAHSFSLFCSEFSENEVNDFASGTSFFSGDDAFAFADDDSPPDEILFDLFDFAGDVFDDFTVDVVLRLFLGGDFLGGEGFDGESF